MAKTKAVWGIDIGQSALKAIRCVAGDDASRITADAFDYIEYPKILSQPEADPVELVSDALRLFLSRNSVHGDRVAISVSGQSGLARFIKLPPVESKKIPDIVKYEARQQIPFALEDVVWDYQQMAGGSEDEGFALETEVGLFAMKRDQVFRALRPFEDAAIEVDIVQLTPLAIYNYTVFDQMYDLPPADQYDPENPPESLVVLSLGTDSTDLVITNGYRVWQRSIPLGGSHFTKALTKELRLTFAKAEHLKRNATAAEDPKAVFQAMRPVFNDLLTDIQRSIGYFTSIDRSAKIGRVVALGNAMKLPGLQKYLSQNLGYPISEVESYRGLSGSAVLGAPAFKENLLSFAVSYGLALQGLNKSALRTNLLPREIVTDRMIRAKKPWTVGLVAALLLGCAVSFLGHWRAWESAHVDKYKDAFVRVEAVETMRRDFAEKNDETKKKVDALLALGSNLTETHDRRLQWLELMEVVKAALPRDPEGKRPAEFKERREIHLVEMELEFTMSMKQWFKNVIMKHRAAHNIKVDFKTDAAGFDPALYEPKEGEGPPDEKGWIVQLAGFHFYQKGGELHAANEIVKFLEEGKVMLPDGPGRELKEVSCKQLGISSPVRVDVWQPADVVIALVAGQTARDAAAAKREVKQYDFIIQFAWKETPRSKRIAPPAPGKTATASADASAAGEGG